MITFRSTHNTGSPFIYVFSLVFLIIVFVVQVGLISAEPSAHVVEKIEEYFPDKKGNEWTYRGQFIEGGMVQIAEKSFTNVSTVMGDETKDGIAVVVFHDTNPGDQGPSDSYYHRDAAGIRYYGSKPGTTLEKQLIPYQIVRFPLEIPSSFQQLDRKGLDLGVDLDRDGKTEQVDVHAVVSVLGKETVTVPLGTYVDAIRVEASMKMNVHLSQLMQTIRGTDTMTAWFARGVGLLKYEERQTIPSLGSNNDKVILVKEELEKAKINGQALLSSRSEPSSKGIFTYYPFYHKLP